MFLVRSYQLLKPCAVQSGVITIIAKMKFYQGLFSVITKRKLIFTKIDPKDLISVQIIGQRAVEKLYRAHSYKNHLM